MIFTSGDYDLGDLCGDPNMLERCIRSKYFSSVMWKVSPAATYLGDDSWPCLYRMSFGSIVIKLNNEYDDDSHRQDILHDLGPEALGQDLLG
jgi:hypothetical protein